MAFNCEIVLPLRNPSEVLEKTARSLAEQTRRDFSVLISDNFSTNGRENIEKAAKVLRGSGISLRLVKPPEELGRVEHWNWCHHECQADWVKPLFAGDWLEVGYFAALAGAVEANPQCRFVYCSYLYHRGESPATAVINPWAGSYRSPAEMVGIVLRNGMQFGPPSAAAYERTAFLSLGGYAPALPICADSLLFCTLASQNVSLGLAETLCHFNIHAGRFSTTLPEKRKATFSETITYYLMLAYHAWTANVPFSRRAFAKLLLREFRNRSRAAAAG